MCFVLESKEQISLAEKQEFNKLTTTQVHEISFYSNIHHKYGEIGVKYENKCALKN